MNGNGNGNSNGNGNGRLHRSSSDVAIGGVAAGLASYLKTDPTLVRLAFVLATILTGGAFLAVYLAMWLLIPAATSSETEPGKIINENLNDLGARVRGFAGGAPTQRIGAANVGPSGPSTEPVGMQGQDASQPSTATTHAKPRICPQVLILIGGFFLLLNMGAFRAFQGFNWGAWWPLILVAIGVIMLTRRK